MHHFYRCILHEVKRGTAVDYCKTSDDDDDDDDDDDGQAPVIVSLGVADVISADICIIALLLSLLLRIHVVNDVTVYYVFQRIAERGRCVRSRQ